MKVYFISGLAADKRVFKHIRLPQGYEPVHLDWIKPLRAESLKDYALRLAVNIDPAEDFALVGLSMGGMIASEIASYFKTQHANNPLATVLLSSVPSYKHFPPYFKLAGLFRFYKLVPVNFFKSASIFNRFFSPDSEDDKIILKQVIKESDPAFIKWAIQAILQWKNDVIPYPLIQIHGTRDKILPVKFTQPTHLIENGKHLMIMSRAEELNNIIAGALPAIPAR